MITDTIGNMCRKAEEKKEFQPSESDSEDQEHGTKTVHISIMKELLV